MSQNVIQGSFAAGEVNIAGRVDLAKYKSGLALSRNFFTDFKGGNTSRPGSMIVGRCLGGGTAFVDSDPVRLIPFTFSTTQTYMLEFGNLYMRVMKDSAYVTETPKNITGITNANPAVVTSNAHGFSNGDWVFISGVGGMSQVNGKTFIVAGAAANTFQLNDLNGTAVNSTAFGVYTAGGTAARIFTLTTPYASTDLALLKYSQSADTMTLTHPGYQARDLTRTGHAAWTLSVITYAASLSAPTNLTSSTTLGGGNWTMGYTVTAVSGNGDESIVPAAPTTISVNDRANPGVTISWRGVQNAVSYNVYKADPVANTGFLGGTTSNPQNVGSAFGYMTTVYGVIASDNGSIAPDYATTPPIHFDPFATGALVDVLTTASGAGYPNTVTASITSGTGSGAIIAPVVNNGAINGFNIVSRGSGYLATDTITLAGVGPGVGFTGTIHVTPATGTYPAVSSYFQQRKLFAASTNAPDTIWGSKPGSFKNFDTSTPINDGDAYTFSLNALQVNAIKFMVPMPSGLVVLTSSGAWQLSGGSGPGTPVTPTSALAQPQAFNGCADVQPLTINYEILYVQNRGSAVRDLSYNFYSNVYTGTDISMLASQLFEGHTITEWCWAEEPFKLVWAIRDDGLLLSMTFMKEQEINAWCRHDTFGVYLSIAQIQEGSENAVYYIVKRLIGGRWIRYVERFKSRLIDDAENSWCLDSALEYPLINPVGTLSVDTASGSATFTCTSASFASGDVGKIIRMGGGVATVTSFISTTQVVCNITTPITDLIVDDSGQVSTGVPRPQVSGDWSMTPQVSSVNGLDHLEGLVVTALCDGNVVSGLTISGGGVTLPQPASRIIAGLPFQAQMQSLRLDVGEPTIQGKRKKIAALTVRVDKSRGLKFGPTFSTVREHKDRPMSQPLGQAIVLTTGDQREVMAPWWTTEGQICIQQDYPLPAKVLAIIPEVVVGDK